MGIVNGTTNFILTRMGEQGADYATVLAEAQELGLAERDPTADVEGFDAAAKAAILAGVAFGYDVSDDAVGAGGHHRDHLRRRRLRPAGRVRDQAAGHRRAVRRRRAVGAGPPGPGAGAHPLAGVRDAFNAVFIEGEAAGELMLYGRGPGACRRPARWWAT